ncbi:MAG: MBL fold metallo-hydrolase [Pseudomonadota bacterium]
MKQLDAGRLQDLAPGLRGILAPNPGPMTYWGTNTFIVGERQVAIVDPGPMSEAHLAAILKATAPAEITHILVTHPHLDHSPLAPLLSVRTGAPVYGFGRADAGRRPVMSALADAGLAGGGEGVDGRFFPDVELAEGDRIEGEDWSIDVLHTPGHFAGHLSFKWQDIVLSGDHVMDWSSSLVSPPDGDVTDFMATSRRLRDDVGGIYYPAHGGPLFDPSDRLDWLITHRQGREDAILNALSRKHIGIPALTRTVYTETPEALLPAAERNVFAHLIDLVERKLVVATPTLGREAMYQLA